MSRLNLVNSTNATPEQQQLLDGIQSQLGMVPNFLRALANSPVALRAFLGLHGVAGAGVLDGRTRERIALALAQANGCQYCVSAHTAIGRKAGLSNAEVAAARAGGSDDAQASEAVRFALSLAAKTGEIDATELMAMRNAGYSDAAIVEIITHVGMNLLTNILGKAGRIDIDFPTVEMQLAH